MPIDGAIMSRVLTRISLAACLLASLPAIDSSQAAADDDRLRSCVSRLSSGLRNGMTEDDYPMQAKEEGRGGTVRLQFSVDYRGALGQQMLVHSSGDKSLDDAALHAARRLFPPTASAPPECRLGYSFTAVLAVVFKILPGED
jgi:TonB family protein